MWYAIGIATIVVIGTVVYLLLSRRAEQRTLATKQAASQRVVTDMLHAQELVDAEVQRVQAEIDALEVLPSDERAAEVLSRVKRWPQ